ncbi:MAG: homoserine kinase [Gammaproteobacteria bacterium]|nr:homoserine kinase [Gammaproteobacteria bacterium]
MNAVTQLDVLQLDQTIARYDIGELIRYWPAADGIENSNYFLRTSFENSEREYVLTIVEQPSHSGGAYVSLLDASLAAGLPVARVIRNRQGNPYDELAGKPVLLAPRLSGRHPYNPTVKQIEALASFTARFHLATANLEFPVPGYPRDAAWLAELLAITPGRLPYTSGRLLKDTVDRVTALLKRQDVKGLPKGVIHGDLFRDNVLFNERGLNGVLDFHHAATGYLIYDIAVIANDWCTDADGLLDPERTVSLVRAYHRLRPFTKQELWFFPSFTLYAAVTFWLSRLSTALNMEGSDNQRFNNPEEFQRIVQQHSAHPFYLDERLLNLQ